MKPLRLMLYDRTDGSLSLCWRMGGWLYWGLRRLDAWLGVGTWREGLDWLATYRASQPIAEIQYWGHGNPGMAMMAGDPLDARALDYRHPLNLSLAAIRSRMGNAALWWFRTCSTFNGPTGREFARDWSRFFGTRVAGHTFVIGPWQSGLHSLGPHDQPNWPVDEGTGLGSSPSSPNTITCFHGAIPPGY